MAYSGGFGGMGGSMNLTAIGTLVGSVSKSKGTDQYKACLKRLLDNLDAARGDGSYAEYLRLLHGSGPVPGRLQRLAKNGMPSKVRELPRSSEGRWISFSGGSYETGMSLLLALALNYRFLPIYER